MTRYKYMLLSGLLFYTASASAQFAQEVELNDGTILSGYVYRQQPSKFMVFHAESAKKDPKTKYVEPDKNYILQWSDVKYIRRSSSSDEPWCDDKVTLKNGTTYTGQIVEQRVGSHMVIRLKESGKKVTVRNKDLMMHERMVSDIDKNLWFDRPYTNRLKMTDDSIHEGLIVLQLWGEKESDSYMELLHGNDFRERIFLSDIKEYIIILKNFSDQ